MKAYILATTLAVLPFIQSADAATVIVNGDFEQGTVSGNFNTLNAGNTTLTGWTIGGSIDHIGSYWDASSGNQSLDMSGNGPGSISQKLTDLVVGQLYEIFFDLAGNPDGVQGQKILEVSVALSNGLAVSYDFFTNGASRTNMGWQGENFRFTATGATATLKFASLTNTAYGPALDNVRIQAVPVPAGAPLLIGGILALGALRRRRRAA